MNVQPSPSRSAQIASSTGNSVPSGRDGDDLDALPDHPLLAGGEEPRQPVAVRLA